MLVYDFLKNLRQVKGDELNKAKNELNIVDEDCKRIEDILKQLEQVSFAMICRQAGRQTLLFTF